MVDTLFKDTKGEDLKRIAIEQEEIKISYGQLISNVNSVANAFLSQYVTHKLKYKRKERMK